jgi:hypothetical protein
MAGSEQLSSQRLSDAVQSRGRSCENWQIRAEGGSGQPDGENELNAVPTASFRVVAMLSPRAVLYLQRGAGPEGRAHRAILTVEAVGDVVAHQLA